MGNRLIWAGFSCFAAPGTWITSTRPVIRCYDDAGHLVTAIPFPVYTGYPNFLLGLPSGDVLAAIYLPSGLWDGHVFTGNTVRRFTRDGYEVATPLNHRNRFVNQITLDGSGNAYLSGEPATDAGDQYPGSGSRSGYFTTRKFNSGGAEVWRVDSGMEYYVSYGAQSGGGRICVDRNGDLIVSIVYGANKQKRLKKLSQTDGSTMWDVAVYSTQTGYELFDGQVAVDSSNRVYIVGYEYDSGSGLYSARIYQYNSAGVLQNSVAFVGGLPLDFKIDGSDVLHYFCADFYKKFDSSLTNTFTCLTPAGYPNKLRGGVVDSAGRAYTGYSYWTSYIDPNGAYPQILAWDATGATATRTWDAENYSPLPKPNGTWADPSCLAVAENVETPALPLPLALAVPLTQGDAYALVPALPLALALAAPLALLDYLGTAPWVYRLYLTGGTGAIELPLESLSCRKTASGIGLTAVCPALTAAQITAIGERTDGMLIVKRGVRLRDGTELLDELVRAPFTTLRWDSGGRSASGTLTAQAEAPPVNTKTRVLQGVSYRNANNGTRRARGAVDTYLAVGDVALLPGGETLQVAEITYFISPTSAQMDIGEVAV